ncbi:sugar phosphate isomerase/epimerase [Rhodocytophaga rosea]|uniref:Sugar phosphate isomerase/epimerase n=1 Tax=Rhodocytophaga rosea TaxID=2704465 RepID=A0A6C0GNT2_9BACT|nr:sugar phosphate isomerase/epimerase family protein [Rhodocytophaga rosea]QHT69283.1 sugar phosphate isomerase/epimerase [Rhodocytophaga rosea]
MRLGISTYTYTWAIGVPGKEPKKRMDAKALLQKAIDLGVYCVQFADNLPLHTFADSALRELGAFAQNQGIFTEIGMRGLFPELVLQYIAIAKQLGSPFLRIVVDGPGFHPSPQEIIDRIEDLIPDLKQSNIILAIENHDRFTARTFASIIEKLGTEQVGICLDSVNSMGAGEGIETVVDILAPYTVNLHVKDFQVQRVYHMMGFVVEGRPAGKGMLRTEWLLEKLAPYNKCQSAILELWTPPEENILAIIEKENRWAEESIRYLKPIIS